MIPLVFFQGFTKTIFFCELNKVSSKVKTKLKFSYEINKKLIFFKLYVSCLNGINHLMTLLSIYGVCSLVSIIILAALMILFNYKRKVKKMN